MKKFTIPLAIMAFVLAACSSETDSVSSDRAEEKAQQASNSLQAILDARSDEHKARDSSRHPKQTIEFFGLKPGMKIAELLPGRGWYTQILAPYVGKEGAIYGISYADDMWARFGFMNEEVIAKRIASSEQFAEKVASFAGTEGVTAKGFAIDRIPTELNGTLDAVVMVRALHNLNRFEKEAGTRSAAMKQLNSLLKPGGIVGVVQHRAPVDAQDSWADGSNGYLKQASVVKVFEQAGFELVASSEINANLKDRPASGDSVWRLPPSLRTAPENKPAMMAIGESDRMTLKFRKIQ